MPLPAIALAAARAGGSAARGAGRMMKKGKGLGGPGGGDQEEKPGMLTPKAISLLLIAGVLDIANIIIGFLDFAFGLGIVLGPLVNLAGIILIGGRVGIKSWKRFLKKALRPYVLNTIPIIKFFPWWLLSAAQSIDWTNAAPSPQPQEEQPRPMPRGPKEPQPKAA